MKIQIEMDNCRERVYALYCKYGGQNRPQPAYVFMNEDGTVYAECSYGVGNIVSSDVWHGRTLLWNVPPKVNCNSLAKALESVDVIKLLERIHCGHRVGFDGYNFVSSLDGDAQVASKELQCIIDFVDTINIWEVQDYLGEMAFTEAWDRDKTLDDAVQDHFDIVSSLDAHFCVDKSDFAKSLLRWAKDEFDNGNVSRNDINYISALLDNGIITQDDVDGLVSDV